MRSGERTPDEPPSRGTPARRRLGDRVTLTAAAALTTAMLPVFLLGALSGAVQAELGFGGTATGAAITISFVSAGLTATPAGRLTERLGAGLALRLGVVAAGAVTAGVGLFATTWWHLAVAYACVGPTIGLIDTGAARRFADEVAVDRQGSAFGLKEASVPAASLLAGLALPTVAGPLGWRGTFTAGLGLAVLVLLLLPRRAAGDDPRGRSPRIAPAHPEPHASPVDAAAPATPASPTVSLVPLAVGLGLGAAAANAAATFLVPALVDTGIARPTAGVVLAVASLGSIAVRILLGRWADDPRRRPLRAAATALAVGAGGAAVLAVTGPAPLSMLGAVTVLAAGWGWTGLTFLAVIRIRPDAPAAAAGIVLTGLGLGGALGPVAFGAVADRWPYGLAWIGATVALATAAAIVHGTVRTLSPRP